MVTWLKKGNTARLAAKYSLLVLALATTFGLAVTSPVHADRDDRGGREDHDRGPPRGQGWDRHVRDNNHWRRFHPHYEPGYVYAPPAVVYAPPPPSGISLFFPLDIR
jgi:hypothetical protein